MMNEAPKPEHAWLQELVGDWTFSSECNMGPDAPPMKVSGTAAIRPLGGFWILVESVNGPDSPPNMTDHRSVIQLGFDPAKGKYVGSFVASMMSMMWPYEGVVEGSDLVLDTEGPSFSGSGNAKYQDIVRKIDANRWELRSRTPDENGVWNEFMVVQYNRA